MISETKQQEPNVLRCTKHQKSIEKWKSHCTITFVYFSIKNTTINTSVYSVQTISFIPDFVLMRRSLNTLSTLLNSSLYPSSHDIKNKRKFRSIPFKKLKITYSSRETVRLGKNMPYVAYKKQYFVLFHFAIESTVYEKKGPTVNM